jgi:hypothetical protein
MATIGKKADGINGFSSDNQKESKGRILIRREPEIERIRAWPYARLK